MDLLYHENRKSIVRFSWFRSKGLNVPILLPPIQLLLIAAGSIKHFPLSFNKDNRVKISGILPLPLLSGEPSGLV